MNRRFPTDWQTRRIDAAGAGACVAGVLLFYFFGIGPVLRRREGRATQRQQLAAQRQNAVKLDQRAGALREKLAEANETLRNSRVRLEPADQINRRIARLADRASGSGLKIDQILPGKPEHGPKHVTVPIRLLGSGSYRAWAAFLHDLARRFPDTSVHSFELSGSPGAQAAPARFRIDLVWHASANRAAAGK